MRCTACHLRRPLFEQAHLIPRLGQFFSPLCEQRSRQVGFSIIFYALSSRFQTVLPFLNVMSPS